MSDTSATRITRVRHEWKILILIATRVKTYFHSSILAIKQVKDNKERNNFIHEILFDRKFLVPIVEMSLKKAPQKLDFVIAKATSKSYTYTRL